MRCGLKEVCKKKKKKINRIDWLTSLHTLLQQITYLADTKVLCPRNRSNEIFSNDSMVNDLVTLTLTFILKPHFGLCCRQGRSCFTNSPVLIF